MQFIVFALKMARCTALEAIVRIDDDNADVGGKGGVGKRRAAQTRYRRQTRASAIAASSILNQGRLQCTAMQ